MTKFGVLIDYAENDLEKIYKPVRLSGEGWYIEVWPTTDMRRLEIRCSGNVDGASALVVLPQVGNIIQVSSRASEKSKLDID